MAIGSPIDWTNFRVALVDWLTSALGGTFASDNRVIWQEQTSPQPARPYASLRLLAGPRVIGHDEIRWRMGGGDVIGDLAGQRIVSVTVDIIASASSAAFGAMQYAGIAQASLELGDIRDTLRLAGIAVADTGTIQNLSAVEGASYVSRATFDVDFAVAANILAVSTPSYIDEIVIDSGP